LSENTQNSVIEQFENLEERIKNEKSLKKFDIAFESRKKDTCKHASNLVSDDTCYFIQYFRRTNTCFLNFGIEELSDMRKNIISSGCFT
jgi:hypothetical protein